MRQAWQNDPWQTLSGLQWQAEYIGLLSNQLDYVMSKRSRSLALGGEQIRSSTTVFC